MNEQPDISIVEKDTDCECRVRQAVNFGVRQPDESGFCGIDMLVLHYTGMESGKVAEDWLCVAESGVSCHYLVHEDGEIVQMVGEEKRAWHAGQSFWRGSEDINSRSIGIEIVNPGHALGYCDFPDQQISALIRLARCILARHDIEPRNVVAHSDIAPGRKIDPGERFPWGQLHHKGVGHWVAAEAIGSGRLLAPGDQGEGVAALQTMLGLYGYAIRICSHFDEQTEHAVSAFQRHFRPQKVDGVADPSTLATLRNLLGSLDKPEV